MKSCLRSVPEQPISITDLNIVRRSFPIRVAFLILPVLAFSLGKVTPVFATVPSSVNFGNVTVGATSKQTATITNSYSFNWVLTSIKVSGSWFKVSGPSLPLTLQSGLSTSFTISFTPTTSGPVTGTVTLVTSSPVLSTISLTGTGATPTLSTSPTSLNFGRTVIGESAVLPVIISNSGTAAVALSSVSISGTGFTLSDLALPLTLNAGQSSSFSVTFDPTTTGTFSGTVSLTSDGANLPPVVSLSGSAASAHSVSLSWTASTSKGVTGYDVYRGTISGGPYTKLNTSVVSGTIYTDKTVTAGHTYYYVTTAVTSTTESGYSNQATAKVPSP